MTNKDVELALKKLANKERAAMSARYFKTGQGEYGYGDVFGGISVPAQRKVALAHKEINFSSLSKLLKSKIHEHRLTALEILVMKYEKAQRAEVKKDIVNFYLAHVTHINNWDLVDSSAPYILGDYLFSKDKKVLFNMVSSENLWERRIAIISTLGFIVKGDDKTTYQIATLLLSDKHDLIHKAVGWMLREAGKRVSEKKLVSYLNENAMRMPRTMLRYAIERLDQRRRLSYLRKK